MATIERSERIAVPGLRCQKELFVGATDHYAPRRAVVTGPAQRLAKAARHPINSRCERRTRAAT
jgi:hypothetical protein